MTRSPSRAIAKKQSTKKLYLAFLERMIKYNLDRLYPCIPAISSVSLRASRSSKFSSRTLKPPRRLLYRRRYLGNLDYVTIVYNHKIAMTVFR